MGAHDELLDAARATTGLDDFGPDSFREGLEILVRSLRDEARLNATGEAAIRQRIVDHLAQRLQVEDWYRRHPEIEDEAIEAPLIGLGLPRTGSTALSFLLAQDPGTRSLLRAEASRPCPPPSTIEAAEARPREPGEVDRRVGARPHVPTAENGPMECQDLMALDFKAQIFQALAQVPSYSRWLLDADLTSTYLYERRVLKLLQWGFPAKPWRLKCPTHILYLPALDRAFPDARFVMTHRDPTEVVLSVADVYADIVGLFTDHVDLHYLGELNVEQWSVGMARAIAFRDGGADHRFYDIDFRAMGRDPVGEVLGLYGWLGEPAGAEFVAGMEAWWKDNAAHREPSTHPDASTYGLDLGDVRPLFADYRDRMAAWTAH